MPQVIIEDFINKHLIKVLWAVVIYFLMNLSSDFKDVKITLQQLLINQATVETRLINLEARAQRNSDRIDKNESSIVDFYKTYELKLKNEK